MARQRRENTLEFKQEAGRLGTEEGLSHVQVGADMGVNKCTIRDGCQRAEGGGPTGPGSARKTRTVEEELAQLRRENRILREYREIQKKKRRPSSRRSAADHLPVHPRGRGQPRRPHALPRAAGLTVGVLRLARRPEPPRQPRRRRAAGSPSSHPSAPQQPLWRPAHHRRAASRGLRGQPRAGRSHHA